MPYEEEDDNEDQDDIYLTVDAAKYPFLKNMKIGDEGTAKFKGEILEQGRGEGNEGLVTSDEDENDEEKENEEEQTYSLITISDLISNKKNVRV